MAIMVAAAFFDADVRGAIWIAMLLWMGVACLANARRCKRTHCRFTGPFFILMAGLVANYATGVLPLGSNGWGILGAFIILGFGFLWWGSEQLWGKFSC